MKLVKKIIKALFNPSSTYSIIPPLLSYLYKGLPLYNLKRFWLKNRSNLNLDNELIKMIDYFIQSKSYKRMSNHWHYDSIKNISQIIESDLQNYSTTIARNYYTWVDIYDVHVEQTMLNVQTISASDKINIYKKQINMSYVDSMKYNNLTNLIYLNLKKLNLLDKLNFLSDEGYLSYNDPFIDINGYKISQDKVNSILDYNSINDFSSLSSKKSILEIGAGSGRTSQAILTFNDNIKYTICDIPPALYLSYDRLKKVFKNKKIGLLYNLSEDELNNQINNYDISFIMPHQVDFIKSIKYDLTIGINCFHEMDKKTIKNYISNINNISKLFYFTVWKSHYTRHSKLFYATSNKMDYFANDYNIPKNWVKSYEKELIFPSCFIGAGFKIDKTK
tara:strand:+ start:416 stop:1588 length:1173 start_codon:yes stop_codon:yes gene_type:complete